MIILYMAYVSSLSLAKLGPRAMKVFSFHNYNAEIVCLIANFLSFNFAEISDATPSVLQFLLSKIVINRLKVCSTIMTRVKTLPKNYQMRPATTISSSRSTATAEYTPPPI